MLKLAVNLSMIFTEVPLLERFALAAQHGFKHIEIQFPYELSIATIQEKLEQYQLDLCLINVPAGDLMQHGNGLACIPSRQAKFKQAVELALSYATALNVKSINILAGKQPHDLDREVCVETFVHNLKYAVKACEQAQIQPVFEMINGNDMPHFLIQKIAQAQQILKKVNHPLLKMQFDCYHMAKMQENVLLQLQKNIEKIGHIQFADYPNRHEPDTGHIDFEAIFTWLSQSEYANYVAAEYRPKQSSCHSFAWKSKYFTI